MASLLKYTLGKVAAPYHANRRRYGTEDVQEVVALTSSSVYVGNMSFYTTEDQVHALFSTAGLVNRVIMGLHRIHKTPCGFCFVVFAERQGLVNCMNWLNGCMLDGRPIRTEVDKGFREGRQYGRGATGGQVRDDMRMTFDAGRGGLTAASSAVAAENAGPSVVQVSSGRQFRLGPKPSRPMPRGPPVYQQNQWHNQQQQHHHHYPPHHRGGGPRGPRGPLQPPPPPHHQLHPHAPMPRGPWYDAGAGGAAGAGVGGPAYGAPHHGGLLGTAPRPPPPRPWDGHHMPMGRDGYARGGAPPPWAGRRRGDGDRSHDRDRGRRGGSSSGWDDRSRSRHRSKRRRHDSDSDSDDSDDYGRRRRRSRR